MPMPSPLSPEQRRQMAREARAHFHRQIDRVRPGSHLFEVAKRVAVGTYSDGFIHAGNLAYLSLMTLFPFFIVAAAVASIFGRTQDGVAAVNAFLYTVPRGVADVVRQPISDVLTARSGPLLWLGGLVGLWTVGSLIETIRDILRRAYGTRSTKPFWRYRLGAIGITLVSVFAVMFAFSLQIVITGVDQFLHRILPWADEAIALVASARLVPMGILCVALWSLYVALTPTAYKDRCFPKWPGAVATALWWYGTVLLLPPTLSLLGGYGRTYGSLAGVMITLIFFFLVGLGVVIGAELNAALAEFPEEEADATAQDKGNGTTI
ncbi:YihY/virulence factor BrkB family protein [Sphingobium naphthae]|jgi:membrane protein|uniref:YihY/virulence factor BrkB family protein n=1 Tax=Sphingobium naphthae TaxID=1886786 RepID=A0ABU3ZY43_9SPHN|nr:YihY/virulence factor BrkB family protein [Sphingobium naphthae]MCC4250925.1 YihY/virulence factor BrkB family protein [Sphingobium naphthae]MDV5824431.1 YihY/virulence factor BrkB family protein [Sphingobium naphthae]MEC8034268.1 YihY/virulence factor BrkB family protein [Pseudomonadota bacterium]